MTNSQSIGNHSNNNTQNLYITNIEQRTLIPTVIFQLLKYVEGFHSQNDEKFLLEQPAELKAKLQFNNSRRYIRLFKEGLGNYILLEKVLKDEFTDSQRVVENIKNIFMDHTPIDEEGNPTVGNGDECLKKMHDDIKERIARDPDFLSSQIDLFDISDPKNDLELGELKQELKKIKSEEKNYKKTNPIDDVVKIKQINVAIDKEIDRLEKEINDLVNKKVFEKNRVHINDIRKKYEEISRQLSKIDFDILQLQKYIKEAEEKSQRIVNQELANDFFQEISELLPSITKTFLDLVEFNSQLSRNKLSYFNDRIQELIREKESKENILTELTEKNSEFISLVEENKVDLYYDKLNQLNELKIKKVQNESTIISLENIEKQKQSIEKRLSELEMTVKNNEVEYQKKMDIFNSYFKNVAGRINKEQPVLLYNPKTDEFPVSIDQLSEGTSTGTRKSLIAAYDIAYQLFARKINKVTPKFIVHDVLESIEGDDIRALVNEVESNQIQYISAILKEKLVSSGISLEEQNKMIILELSMKDRLFEK